MADTKIVTLDVQSNIDESAKSVGSLKAQLREAQAEVATLSDKFGATSKEAVEAAKKASELKDKIGDAKALTDAFNPDAKFKSFTETLSGAAGGLSAVTGAMGLLGAESENVQGMILKVQSAMAISQGLQAVGEARDSFKQLLAVVQSFSIVQKISTAAQWLWNAAMNANPIGAIVVVVTALISAGYALVKMFQASSDATEANAKANSALTSEINNLEKANKKASQESELSRMKQLGLAKANGESAESIRKLTLELAKQEEAEKLLNMQRARRLYYSAQSKLLDDEENEVAKENVKKAKEQYQKMFDDYNTSVLNTKKVRIQNQIDEAQERTNANKKVIEDNQKHLEDLQKIRDDANKKRKEKEEQEYKERNELAQQRGRNAEEQYAKEQEDRLNSLDSELTNILDFEARVSENDKKHKDEEIEREKAVSQAKKEIQDATFANIEGGLSLLKVLFEKNKAIQKGAMIVESALGIAKIIVNTQTANAVAAASPLNAVDPTYATRMRVMNMISAGIGIASNIAATAKGLSALGGGGGAPSGGDVGSGGGGAPSAPSFNVVGNGGANQIAGVIANQNMPPVQAYVVASNVTSAQSLNRNIINNATLG